MAEKGRSKTLRATIDRFETTVAVLRLPDRQELKIPRSSLAPDVKEGDVFVVRFLRDEESRESQAVIAKRILNEFLKGSSSLPDKQVGLPASSDGKKS